MTSNSPRQAGRELAVLARGLTKSFGETRALRGIDLDIPSGSVLGVLGPNGAGKTTAAREGGGNSNPTLATSDAWPLTHPVIATLLLCVALTALFAPLAIARYRRITRG